MKLFLFLFLISTQTHAMAPKPAQCTCPCPTATPAPTIAPTPSPTPKPSPTPTPRPNVYSLQFTINDWRDVWGNSNTSGALTRFEGDKVTFTTRQITGQSGVDSSGNAIGTTSIFLMSKYFDANPVKDFRATINFKNKAATRIGTPYNAWEGCLWFIFNAATSNNAKPFNYIAFKTKPSSGGLEGGYAYDSVGQYFWNLSAPNFVFPFLVDQSVIVEKIGKKITVFKDGKQISTAIIDASKIKDIAGSIGLYTEDGSVEVSKLVIERL